MPEHSFVTWKQHVPRINISIWHLGHVMHRHSHRNRHTHNHSHSLSHRHRHRQRHSHYHRHSHSCVPAFVKHFCLSKVTYIKVYINKNIYSYLFDPDLACRGTDFNRVVSQYGLENGINNISQAQLGNFWLDALVSVRCLTCRCGVYKSSAEVNKAGDVWT